MDPILAYHLLPVTAWFLRTLANYLDQLQATIFPNPPRIVLPPTRSPSPVTEESDAHMTEASMEEDDGGPIEEEEEPAPPGYQTPPPQNTIHGQFIVRFLPAHGNPSPYHAYARLNPAYHDPGLAYHRNSAHRQAALDLVIQDVILASQQVASPTNRTITGHARFNQLWANEVDKGEFEHDMD